MDLKPLSWVDNMYQRLESLCVEVEENMYQDTVKYVEDQMQTVGANVKKFCSDVMDDLLPPSSLDTLKEENPLLTVLHHADVVVRPKVIDEKTSLNTETERLLNDSDVAAYGDNSVNIESDCTVEPCGIDVVGSRCVEFDSPHVDNSATNDLNNRGDSKCKVSSDTSSMDASATEVSTESFDHIEVQNKGNESVHGLADVSFESASVLEVSYSEVGGVEITDHATNGIEGFDGSETPAFSNGNLSPDPNGTSKFMGSYAVQSDDADNQRIQLGMDLDKVKLEESCVFVDKNVHSLIIPLKHEQKSYKKKIRNVLTSKRWSRGKQDKGQRDVVSYEEDNRNLSVSNMPIHARITDSQSNESFESEWELL